MNSTSKSLFYKIFSLLSVVRGYNILILILAQYLAAIFIFSDKKSVKHVLLDLHLFYLILATITVVAAGYIINNFYDVKADKINRPLKSNLDGYINEDTKLGLYFFLNFLGATFGFLVSWRAAVFFSVYIFGIWFYSHKLKKYPLLGLVSSTVLTITPFFAIFVHYMNFSKIIFVHAFFLFLVIMVRELIKNLENIKGAIVNNYATFPVVYGEKRTKQFSLILLTLTLLPIFILLNYSSLGFMEFYFYFAMISLLFVGIYLIKATQIKQYRLLHNILKLLLLIGVFSLIFIDPAVLIEKVIDTLN